MATIGKVVTLWTGAFSTTQNYHYLDLVELNNIIYICINKNGAVAGSSSPDGSEDWEVFCRSEQGETGEPGQIFVPKNTTSADGKRVLNWEKVDASQAAEKVPFNLTGEPGHVGLPGGVFVPQNDGTTLSWVYQDNLNPETPPEDIDLGSLKGDKGDKGDMGIPGDSGTAGFQVKITDDKFLDLTLEQGLDFIRIELEGTPDKKEYVEGSLFDSIGLKVYGVTLEGIRERILNSDCIWLDKETRQRELQKGTTEVICRYGSLETVYSGITVTPSPSFNYITLDFSENNGDNNSPAFTISTFKDSFTETSFSGEKISVVNSVNKVYPSNNKIKMGSNKAFGNFSLKFTETLNITNVIVNTEVYQNESNMSLKVNQVEAGILNNNAETKIVINKQSDNLDIEGYAIKGNEHRLYIKSITINYE